MTDDKQKPDGWSYGIYREYVQDFYDDCGMSGSPGPVNPEESLKEKILKNIFKREFKVPFDSTNQLHRTGMEVLKKKYWHLISPFKLVFLDEKENDK